MPKNQLIKTEESYQQIRYQLNTYSSNRIKLELLRIFLNQLIVSKKKNIYHSYFEELLPYFIELITDETLEYRSIDILKSLSKIENTFFDFKIGEVSSPEFQNSHTILLSNFAKTYFYLGEWYKGLKILHPKITNSKLAPIIQKIDEDNVEFPLIYIFEQIINEFNSIFPNKKYDKIHSILLNIIDEWREKTSQPQFGKLWVLLAEQESSDFFNNHDYHKEPLSIGTIQQIVGKTYLRPNDTEEDLILFNNRSISYNDLLFQQANDAISIAKEIAHRSRNRNFKINYSFSEKNPFYTGGSLGLAMSLLNVSNICQVNSFKHIYQLKQNFAVTGLIDISGEAIPIAIPSLKTKLESIVYSPFSSVVIPEKNRKSTKIILTDLTNNYPNRKIDTIPVKSLNEAILNSKITLQEAIPLKQRLTQISKGWYFILLLLLIPIYLSISPNLDKNPVELKVGGSKVEVYNITGKKLWDYDFGYKLDVQIYENKNDVNRSLYVFDDLNNDGLNELIIGFQHSEVGKNGSLHVFGSKGKLLWKYDQHPVMTFGENEYNNIYTITNVKTHTFDGKKIIFASFCKYIWCPSRLVAFDINGNVLGEYWNSGIAHIKQFFDIDEDGIDEIFLAGCNNDFNKGIIAILEHDHINGHSPQLNEAYIPKCISKGSEKYYIKFPDPEELLISTRYGAVIQINLIGDQIIVREKLSQEDHFCAFYILNKNLEITSFVLNDTYIANYKKDTGRDFLTDFPPSKLKELFYKLEFWNGEKFVSYKALSRPDLE